MNICLQDSSDEDVAGGELSGYSSPADNMTPKNACHSPQPKASGRRPRMSLSSWWDEDDDGRPGTETDGENLSTTASDMEAVPPGCTSPRKSGSPTRRTRGSRSLQGLGKWRPSGAATCPQERRAPQAECFILSMGDDSSDGENLDQMCASIASAMKNSGGDFSKSLGDECVPMQLFKEPEPTPASPRTALMSSAEGVQGMDLRPSTLSSLQKSGIGQPLFRQRRNTFSGRKRSGSCEPPPPDRMSFKPLRRNKAATTEDAEVEDDNQIGALIIAVKKESRAAPLSSSSSAAVDDDSDDDAAKDEKEWAGAWMGGADVEQLDGSEKSLAKTLGKKFKESRDKREEFNYFVVLPGDNYNISRRDPLLRTCLYHKPPLDFRGASCFERKLGSVPEGGTDIDLGVLKKNKKGKRVAALEPEEFARVLREKFLKHGVDKDVGVIAVSQKYTQIFGKANGMDLNGPSLEGGVNVVMELLDDVRGGAMGFASWIWGGK